METSRNLAPIALFVYNRPGHTQQTIEALKKNELSGQSTLIIFSDGPKNESSKEEVEAVRNYLKTITGFAQIRVVEQSENLGLANSIISGVSKIVNEFGKIIVLEDDLITSPYFLKYMNDGLDLYKNNEDVVSIHGYIYPIKERLPETFFIKGADCWGWATWDRAWKIFEPDGKKLLTALKKRKSMKEFDFGGTYPFTMMLENQIMGINNSWAIRWNASAFLANKLTLYPGLSLVRNIGMDLSGANCEETNIYDSELTSRPIMVYRQEMTEDLNAKGLVATALAKTGLNSLKHRSKFIVRKLLFKLKLG